ncbi:MAG: 4-hydroxybenzoyl-CoA reductase [Candidatus Rokuibacteriota bacterium]|nr:MAG: 4-hydroxybenzoyl-CoA reductase [Candidatus Rokubacteria bacterium]
MIRLPSFAYLAPRTVDEAVRAIADAGPDGMLVAGGTDLYPNMKRRQFEPKVLVGLRAIGPLRGVAGSPRDGVRIGACTTLTAVATHPGVGRDYPALATAAGLYEWRKAIGFCMKKDGDICLVAPGSSRCWAVSSSDTAPALWSLGASVRLAGPSGERTVPIAALFQDDGIQYLAKRADEIVTEILLPPAGGWRSTYLKLRRRGSFDFPILGVAAAARLEGDVVREARIVLGAVASVPREATKAAALLVGHRLTTEAIEAAADAAAGPAKPLDNTDLTHPYRKKVTRVYVARALARLAGLDQGPAQQAIA